MNITQALHQATSQLPTETPRLEAEILLSHVLQRLRTFLYTEPHHTLSPAEAEKFTALIQQRAQGQPIAYLTGEKEFWSLNLKVTPDTLIPRPDTELLVETVLNKLDKAARLKIVDLGTGSGAIALALAKERPHWEIFATDRSQAALSVAQENANRLNISNVHFYLGNWYEALPQQKFHAIVSNPPYIAPEDKHLQEGDLRFEPQSALVAANKGLKDIEQIVHQAREYLLPEGWLWVEHGFDQGAAVRKLLENADFQKVETVLDLGGMERVSGGRIEDQRKSCRVD